MKLDGGGTIGFLFACSLVNFFDTMGTANQITALGGIWEEDGGSGAKIKFN